MTQHGRRETSSDAAPQVDPKFARIRETAFRFFRHTTQGELVAPLVYGELTDSVGYLSRKGEECQVCLRCDQLDGHAKLPVYLLA